MSDSAVPFIFKHEQGEATIRVLLFDGEPWFVGADVCNALGLRLPASQHFDRLEPGQKGMAQIHTPGGRQQMVILNEAGLVILVMGSEKPQSTPFKNWIAEEVIPSIRKTGGYQIPVGTPEPDLLGAINAAVAQINGRLDGIEAAVKNKRKNFSKESERYACEGLAKHRHCECPYCSEAIIVSKYGELLDNAQLHHGNGNARDPSADNCMPICDDCHDRVTYKNRPNHIPAHVAQSIATAFHTLLKQKTSQIRGAAPGGTFWDFRAAVQADMGFTEQVRKPSK